MLTVDASKTHAMIAQQQFKKLMARTFWRLQNLSGWNKTTVIDDTQVVSCLIHLRNIHII